MKQKLNNITSCVWSKKNTQKCTNDPPKLFLITKKCERLGVVLPPKTLKSNEWMAKWQEQEDGSMRNFSIIELARDW
jgi:hypothetical protein